VTWITSMPSIVDDIPEEEYDPALEEDEEDESGK
jgi:hypothetical protein